MQRLSLRLPRLSRSRQHHLAKPCSLSQPGSWAQGSCRLICTTHANITPLRPNANTHQRSRQTRHARRHASTTSSSTSSSTITSRQPLEPSQDSAHVSSLVAVNPSRRTYIFVSKTSDPYLNLSIEATLLARSAPHTAILFTYINRPCVVIGRNQNPWVEVDLARLRRRRRRETGSRSIVEGSEGEMAGEAPGLGSVDLVRRRSGGGAVFHDAGNVNWSVIIPSNEFTRDKHGEMVVRALRGLGVETARVNSRHDIVVDSNLEGASSDKGSAVDTRKVSGSAYKLTRGRALHHGTCLLQSPNLAAISQYLRSPARPYIKAQGVESVRSPVANVGVGQEAFVEAVQRQFRDMYCEGDKAVEKKDTEVIELGEEQLQDPEVRKGYDELKTLDWTYLQTPRFTLSVPPENDDETLSEQAIPKELPRGTHMSLKISHGRLDDGSTISLPEEGGGRVSFALQPRTLHKVADWRRVVRESSSSSAMYERSRSDIDAVAAWLARMFPEKDVVGE